eukprot:328251-Pelagomonas_calceolata.AAC.3
MACLLTHDKQSTIQHILPAGNPWKLTPRHKPSVEQLYSFVPSVFSSSHLRSPYEWAPSNVH